MRNIGIIERQALAGESLRSDQAQNCLADLLQQQGGAGEILGRNLHPDVRGANLLKLPGHDPVRQFGLVAFPAQMRQVKMLQFRGHDLGGCVGGSFIG